MFNVSALLLDDALKPATPLTSGVNFLGGHPVYVTWLIKVNVGAYLKACSNRPTATSGTSDNHRAIHTTRTLRYVTSQAINLAPMGTSFEATTDD